MTAVDFVKNQSGFDKVFLSGHSYGGYLAYAYAMLIGEENLSGIITTGASPYSTPISFHPNKFEMLKYGFYLGDRAFVNPFGMPWTYVSKLKRYLYAKNWKPSANAIFYYNTTPEYIQREVGFHSNDESAGVCVDMFFGKDPFKYGGDWVDPQTLYNYSDNLDKITVPILFIAGEADTQAVSYTHLRAHET